MESELILPLRISVDLLVMVMKRYSRFSKAPELKFYYLMI